MAFSDGGWTQTKPWACSSPDRTGGCSAARPPAAAQSMRLCTSETGGEPRAVCAPEARRLDASCGEARVWRTRMLSESDCVCAALRRQPRVGSRRAGCSSPPVNQTHGGLRDATEYLTGDAPAVRRPGSAPACHQCRGRARLRCGRAIGRGPRVDSGRWGRDDGGELHTGTPNRALAAIGADKDAAASGRSCQNARTGDVSVARRAGRPSSGPFGLPSRRRWSPGRIHCVTTTTTSTTTTND